MLRIRVLAAATLMQVIWLVARSEAWHVCVEAAGGMTKAVQAGTPKLEIEKAAAHASTVFTTVSEVTAFESERLLGRAPEAILPNGLNSQRFAALHEFQNLHQKYKEKINEFVMGHFFPSYTFDLDRTIYLFTSGRYEYRNKGMDLFLESLYRLNHRLKQYVADPPTVVAFIITKAMVKHVNVDVLRNQSMFDELRNTCADIQAQMDMARQAVLVRALFESEVKANPISDADLQKQYELRVAEQEVGREIRETITRRAA